ncbi:MAG: hypothetical protein WCH39_05855 [Schlesneria sp.]
MPESTFNDELFATLTDGLTYSAKFVPQSASRYRNESQFTLNWTITIANSRSSLEFDYSQGLNHLTPQQQNFLRNTCGVCETSIAQVEARKKIVETGVVLGFLSSGNRVKPPEFRDVMHSLLLDLTAIDYGSFEEWADDMGYDSDSRSAEATYRLCLDNGLKLRSMIGGKKNADLHDLFHDY